MKRLAPLAIAVAASTLALGACATGPGPGPYAYGYVDGYYDDAYGPFYDGYWGDDGFYYRTGQSGDYIRDNGGHFRHDSAQGFHTFHARAGHAAAAPAAGGDHHP